MIKSSLLFRAWIVVILAWCSSLFMGVYIHNDHFRTLVYLFAWISSAGLLNCSFDLSAKKGKWLLFIMSMVASVISFLYIVRPYAFDHDQLNTIHLFVWFSLAFVSIYLLYPKFKNYLGLRKLAFFCITIAIVIGGLQYVLMFAGESERWASQQKYASLFTRMRTEIPESDHVCVDPADAEFVGSQSGRSIFFTEQNVYPVSQSVVRRELMLFSTLRSVDEDVASRWKTLLGYNYIPCGQFGLQRRLLSSFYSAESLDRMLGCDRAGLISNEDFVNKLSMNFRADQKDVEFTCPWIVVNLSLKSAWNIPQKYEKKYQDDSFEIYHAVK